jgi:hypothetical protein
MKGLCVLLCAVLCAALLSAGVPLYAKDKGKGKDAAAGAAGGIKLDAQSDAKLKGALRFVARVQMWGGKIDRKDFNAICRALDDKKVWAEASTQIAYMAAEQSKASGGPYAAPQDWLKFLFDNLPAILEMIKTLISLFSQMMPPDAVLYANMDATLGTGWALLELKEPDTVWAITDVATPPAADLAAGVPSVGPSVPAGVPVALCAARGPLRAAAVAVARAAPLRRVAGAVAAARPLRRVAGAIAAARPLRRVAGAIAAARPLRRVAAAVGAVRPLRRVAGAFGGPLCGCP